MAAAVDKFGTVNAIVANAGVQHIAPISVFPEDRWDRLLAVLFTSLFLLFLLAKHAWPHLEQTRGTSLALVLGLGSGDGHAASGLPVYVQANGVAVRL